MEQLSGSPTFTGLWHPLAVPIPWLPWASTAAGDARTTNRAARADSPGHQTLRQRNPATEERRVFSSIDPSLNDCRPSFRCGFCRGSNGLFSSPLSPPIGVLIARLSDEAVSDGIESSSTLSIYGDILLDITVLAKDIDVQ